VNIAFGRSLFGRGVVFLDDVRPPDPDKPDPRAAAEMSAFDELPPEARRQIANGRFGAAVDELVFKVRRNGASAQVRERLKQRGLMPCDVGTEGCVLLEIAILEEAESDRLRRELV
jgi:hypothetical protein